MMTIRLPMRLRAMRAVSRRLSARYGEDCFARELNSTRHFSCTSRASEIRSISELPDRIEPSFQETRRHDLLGLQWPRPPRNILMTLKDNAPNVTESFIEVANHVHKYPSTSIILDNATAQRLHELIPFPVYAAPQDCDNDHSILHDKVDLVSTLGGDGTILRAAALFAGSSSVPPILSFSMGTLGFLGEWKIKDYKRAFREVYMSGAALVTERSSEPSTDATAGWATMRGKFMGDSRASRVLLRNRLKVRICSPGASNTDVNDLTASCKDTYAMNEVIIHRGADPHLVIVEVYVRNRFFTEAVADGMIISTPTGSTAYNLSSGGSIVHPLVSSVLLTPVCPRSLSFRPVVLPANMPITLRLSKKNRGRAVDVSIDGVRRPQGLEIGMELRVGVEEVRTSEGVWCGGVPSIVRGTSEAEPGSEDNWVGGLTSLLKFNYPFGEE